MKPLALTRSECRALDRVAIQEIGIPGLVLMENAGRGCVDVLEQLGIDGLVAVVCGKGNNGGDGFVIARHLAIRGYGCRVLLLAPSSELSGDATTNFAILKKLGVPIAEVGAVSQGTPGSLQHDELAAELSGLAHDAVWLVDALLGTGASGDPRPPLGAMIDWMNSHPARKLAVDVPSGLDSDTGEASAHTVRADHTCTFAAMKIGYLRPAARAYTGTVHVCDIGVPPTILQEGQRS